jgi:hypothetical protein
MALGSTQPLTEMSTRNLPWAKGRPARRTDNLTAICEPTLWKMWEPRCITTLWASTACHSDSVTKELPRQTFPMDILSLAFELHGQLEWQSVSNKLACVRRKAVHGLHPSDPIAVRLPDMHHLFLLVTGSRGRVDRIPGEAPGSDLVPNTNYFDWDFSDFSLVPPDECPNGTARSFLP